MISLDLEKRTTFGKKLGKSRKAGLLPVVVYGFGHESASFFVDQKSFKKVWSDAGESTLVTLSEKADKAEKTGKADKHGKNFDTLIHDVTVNPLTGEPIHADFLAIDASKPVQVSVELDFVGVSPAVKNLGALLVKVLHEVEIEVLPKHLVHSIAVDITKLENFDDKILASALTLPETAKLITEPEEIVALAALPREEEVEEETPPDLTAIEVEQKGKTEEEEGEAPAPADGGKATPK